jgi:TRAP-type C4-dicarboxylate transport system permease small subunit
MSTPPGTSSAGLVFRGLLGATVLGFAGFLALRKKGKTWERAGSIGGVVLGVLLARVWASVGVDWASNLLNWYQQASFLTLLGGLRGVGTRLTLLLALLGGSLATAAGKHITIDVVTRFLRPKARLPVMVIGWLGSAAICFSAAWGFFDHIAIEDFGANSDARAGAKVSEVSKDIGEDFFIARKQMALDFKSLPHVLAGERYSEWLKTAEWNSWLDDAGFAERYGKESVEALKMTDPEATRAPIVIVPERGEPRGELIKAANLVFPIGLFIIALRFILLSLLALSGHMSIDPEAHVEGSDIKRKHGADEDADEEPAS